MNRRPEFDEASPVFPFDTEARLLDHAVVTDIIATETESALVRLEALDRRHLLRLPDPTGVGLEGLAGQANLRRLADSTSRIERALPGLATHAGSQFVRLETPVRLEACLPFQAEAAWAALDSILLRDGAQAHRLILGLEGTAEDVDNELQFDASYAIHRPNLGGLAQKLASHASVMVQSVERHLDSLFQITSDLTTILGVPSHADFVAFGARSFHVDHRTAGTGDLLIVPLDLTLRIGHGDVPAASRDPLALLPGLSISPGQAGLVKGAQTVWATSDGIGLALKISLPLIDAATIRLHAADAARYHPLLRADLPSDLDAPIVSYAGSLYEVPGAFHAEASNALGVRGQEHGVALMRANVPPMPRHGMLKAHASRVGLLPELTAPLPGGLAVTEVDGELALAAGGILITPTPDFAAQLVPQLDGRPFRPDPASHEMRRGSLLQSMSDSFTEATSNEAGQDDHTSAAAYPEAERSSVGVVGALNDLLSLDLLEVAP